MTEAQAYTIGYLTSAIEGTIKRLQSIVAYLDQDSTQSAKSRTKEAIERLASVLEEVEGDN